MAKKETEAKAEATTEGNGADNRYIMIKDPDTGEQVKRVEWIRQQVIEKGRPRGEVAKQLSEIQGKKVPYQIVFAATKDHKVKKEENAENAA